MWPSGFTTLNTILSHPFTINLRPIQNPGRSAVKHILNALAKGLKGLSGHAACKFSNEV
jgi:hypothetical protein